MRRRCRRTAGNCYEARAQAGRDGAAARVPAGCCSTKPGARCTRRTAPAAYASAAAGRARRRCRHAGDSSGYGLTRRRTPPAIRITHHTPHTTARARSRQPETGAAADARVPDTDRAAVGATAGAAAGIEGPGGAAGLAGLCAAQGRPVATSQNAGSVSLRGGMKRSLRRHLETPARPRTPKCIRIMWTCTMYAPRVRSLV